MTTHFTFRVSCKVAIFNPTKTKVLVVEYKREYSDKDYGLPGGHMEEGESPVEAAIREVREETGIELERDDLTKADFWLHRDGKVILGFIATKNEDVIIRIDGKEVKRLFWADIEDIKNDSMSLRDYAQFVIDSI